MQGGGRCGKAAVAVDGIENLQQFERNFHVNKIERLIQNNSLFLDELYAYHGDKAISIIHKELP